MSPHWFHKYEPIALKLMADIPESGLRIPAPNPYTLVLCKCRHCEATKAQRLDGHWTLAQVKGDTA